MIFSLASFKDKWEIVKTRVENRTSKVTVGWGVNGWIKGEKIIIKIEHNQKWEHIEGIK